MTRKSVLLGMGTVLLLAGGVGGVLLLLLRHEPSCYQRCCLPPGDERRHYSDEFKAEFSRLVNGIVNNRAWDGRFTQEQINGYFDEDFVQDQTADKILPELVREPRIHLTQDKVRVAFRYGKPPWSAVISIDLGVWRVAREPNVVALELQRLRAGALPISAQTLMERVTEAARQQNIEVTWYRHNGNPVALLRFQADKLYSTIRLDRLELHHGVLFVSGRSLDPEQRGPADPADVN